LKSLRRVNGQCEVVDRAWHHQTASLYI